MKYLGEEKSVKVKTKSRRYVEYLRCDICGKKIYPQKYKQESNIYIEVSTQHHDWGLESPESIERKELCKECAVKFAREYILSVSSTEEIAMTTEHLFHSEFFDDFDTYEEGYKLTENDKNNT